MCGEGVLKFNGIRVLLVGGGGGVSFVLAGQGSRAWTASGATFPGRACYLWILHVYYSPHRCASVYIYVKAMNGNRKKNREERDDKKNNNNKKTSREGKRPKCELTLKFV